MSKLQSCTSPLIWLCHFEMISLPQHFLNNLLEGPNKGHPWASPKEEANLRWRAGDSKKPQQNARGLCG